MLQTLQLEYTQLQCWGLHGNPKVVPKIKKGKIVLPAKKGISQWVLYTSGGILEKYNKRVAEMSVPRHELE